MTLWNDADVAVDVVAPIGEPSSLPQYPLMAARVVLRMEKRSFLRTWDIVSLYNGVPLWCEMSETSII